MAVKVPEETIALLLGYIKALSEVAPETRYGAQERLQEWLALNPEAHCIVLLQLCHHATSERQKRRLGAILGEALPISILHTIADVGIADSHEGTIARRAIGYWTEQKPVAEAVHGICICLDRSLNHSGNPLLSYMLDITLECASREPDTAFWQVVQHLSSRLGRNHPAAVRTRISLTELLPSPDLPRPSNGSHTARTSLPTPAESNFANSRDLPVPAPRWWNRWKR